MTTRRPDPRTAVTRDQILTAAVECLLEFGYAGTSTVIVQARAGVSRGGLLHHFPTKQALILEAVRFIASVRLAETAEVADRADGTLGYGAERLDAVVAVMWETFHQPHFWATIELWAASRTDDALREALLANERANRVEVRRIVGRLFGPFAEHERYPVVRELLLTSMRGAAITYAFDPREPSDDSHLQYWEALARQMLGARSS